MHEKASTALMQLYDFCIGIIEGTYLGGQAISFPIFYSCDSSYINSHVCQLVHWPVGQYITMRSVSIVK